MSRTVLLPEPVQASSVEARHENGILVLMLRRASTGAEPDSSGVMRPVEAHIDDLVEEASEESFPASDAPGWLPQHV